MIDGILIEPLKVFSNEKGEVRHMIKADAPFFHKFGEIYFSTVNPGYVKGWKKHLRMTQHFAVPVGNLKLVLFDDRGESPTKGEVQEITFGEDNYCLVRIPPGIWYSFAAVGGQKALITNCADLSHEPGESVAKEIEDESFPYRWKLSI